jgi:2-oxoisovalerate dehydrogenase E1 component
MDMQVASRVHVVQGNLVRYLSSAAPPATPRAPGASLRPGSSLTIAAAVEIWEDQVRSRLVDVLARELKAKGKGYYTISSAGHEQNAVVGRLLRGDDPCFLHYRSGALFMARSRRFPGIDPLRDAVLSLVCAAEDPASGGRHKVWGSRTMWIPPQTSTIASHLPKAMGLAFHLERARRLGVDPGLSRDAVVLCSFGDASVNHATAHSGINAARYAFRKGNPTPILWMCEDNRVGISVGKPRRWIADSFSGLSQMSYRLAQGDLVEIWDTVEEAVDLCRARRKPVFLRLPTVRLWGHAGSDVETTYHTLEQIEAVEAQDPLLHNARLLVEEGAADPRALLAFYQQTWQRLQELGEELAERPKLHGVEEITAPLFPFDADRVRASAEGVPDLGERRRVFGERLPEEVMAPTKRTLAAHVNAALSDEMIRRPQILVFGEDVARKGGVYYVTQDLQRRFGKQRVFDTLLDETTILGLAQGAAHLGLLPVPEIQYLAYLHNAIDQIRGEAASLAYFSAGRFTNPMVVRLASFAYQKGFGGHFHNDHAVGALREIPGLVLAAPSRGDDAARMLRGALALAAEHGRVVCFLEPIALYHEKDLHEEGDGLWLSHYPPPGSCLLPGEVGIHHEENEEVLLVSYANGLRLCLRAARRLAAEHGVRARVLDLRWLAPLPLAALRRHADACGAVVVADECRSSAGVADALVASLAEGGYRRPVRSARSVDTYLPLGPAADLVLLSEDAVFEAALSALAPTAGRDEHQV